MKKKIMALCLVVALLATAIAGATLAYFTDNDAALNTFTMGNVDITLEEKFPESELKPGQVITKEASIKNEGSEDAYVWAEILIPAVLDDGYKNEPSAPGLENSLHFNYPGAYSVEYAQNTNAEAKFYNADLSKLWIHKHNADGLKYGYVGQETIDGIVYNKYIKFYKDPLAAGEETSLFLNTVYMDAKVAQCVDPDCSCQGKGVTLYGGECYNGDWELIVRAYAIQDEGFENVIDAWKAYDGAKPAI